MKINPQRFSTDADQRRLPDSNRSKVPEDPQRLACKQWLNRFSAPARGPERAACNTFTYRQALLLAAVSVCAYAAAWLGWRA